jgi:hypothetical protein
MPRLIQIGDNVFAGNAITHSGAVMPVYDTSNDS